MLPSVMLSLGKRLSRASFNKRNRLCILPL